MNRRSIALGGAALVTAAVLLLSASRANLVEAAAPEISNPFADITDFYAWMWDDDGTASLALAVNVFHGAPEMSTFPGNVSYAVHLDRGGTESQVICHFESADNTSTRCWFGDAEDNVLLRGDATDAAAPLEADGIKVFAGHRDDPAFFNTEGFAATTAFIHDACVTNDCSGLMDANGCPDLSGANPGNDITIGSLGEALEQCLGTDCADGPGSTGNGAATNGFAGAEVLSLVISIPESQIPGSGVIAAYASTHER
jgi:hypothetical protein